MSWKQRRVLVTGADGFIGSHLTECLVREGCQVRAFCFYNLNGSWGWLDKIDPEVKSLLDVRLGDIRDSRFTEEACKDIEVVFHLAALIAIPYSYEAPESFLETNVRGTLNVLEAVKRCACARMVHTSTSEVYGSPDSLPIREIHPLKPQSPYAASKVAADKMCEAYACSFSTPVVILRPFNTYGPRQSPRAVLPTIVMQLLAGAKKVRLGNLWPKRDLTFVEDTVEGFLLAGSTHLEPGEVIQLGTGVAVSVQELFEKACEVLNAEAEVVVDHVRVRPPRSEVDALLSDPSYAWKRLGWRANCSLEEGLRRTAEWMAHYESVHGVEHYYV